MASSDLDINIKLINEFGYETVMFHRGESIGAKLSFKNNDFNQKPIKLEINLFDPLDVPIEHHHEIINIEPLTEYEDALFFILPLYTYVGVGEYRIIIHDLTSGKIIYSEVIEFYTSNPDGIDLFCDRGGFNKDRIACSYGPNELLNIQIQVNENLEDTANPVFLIILDNNENVIDEMDFDFVEPGKITYSTRLASEGNIEELFGVWRVQCILEDRGVKYFDEFYFQFGYILDVVETEFIYDQEKQVYNAVIEVESIYCEDLPAILSISIENEFNEPVLNIYSQQVFFKNSVTPTIFNDIISPEWVSGKHHLLFITLTGTQPENFGIPYCPMKTSVIK